MLFAITVHEVAHGWVAKRLGDPTAQRLGRLTLNPIKHIDPIGTLLLPAALILLKAGFIFGWAKPVPVTWENLRHPKRDMALVAVAGPLANLSMAFIWALIAKLGSALPMSDVADVLTTRDFIMAMGQAGIWVNAVLMVLNLLPLPPLDGGRVVVSLLPGRLSWQFSRIEPYGFFILLGLLMFHVLEVILWPPVHFVVQMVAAIVGLS